MLESFVKQMMKSGANSDEIVRQAISLSRDAFQQVAKFEKAIDRLFGSPFRKKTIDVLLDKERQIDALRERSQRGESTRNSDKQNLQALLSRRIREYEALRADFPWNDLKLADRNLVKSYITERRKQLRLGDPERVKRTYTNLLAVQAPTAIAC